MEHDKNIFISAKCSRVIFFKTSAKFVFPISSVQGGVLGAVGNYKEV